MELVMVKLNGSKRRWSKEGCNSCSKRLWAAYITAIFLNIDLSASSVASNKQDHDAANVAWLTTRRTLEEHVATHLAQRNEVIEAPPNSRRPPIDQTME
jgi:hypothetical protein